MYLNQYFKYLTLIFTAFFVLSLSGCDNSVAESEYEKSNPGQSGDDGIQREKEKSGDEDIQIEPVNPDANPAIIIPPPTVNMPADIVPEPAE